MTKQEFLSASLPYGLKMCLTMNIDDYFDYDDSFDTELLQKGTIWDLSGIYNGDSYISVGDGDLLDLVLEKNGTWVTLLLGDAKPIIRHSDMLVQECVQADYNNGDPFIPIVELARMAFPEYNWQFDEFSKEGAISFDNSIPDTFEYDNEYGVFRMYGFAHHINQLQLLQQLLKWHFWPNMPEGEQVVYVTEDFNPYK